MIFFFLSSRWDSLYSNYDFEASPVFLHGLGGGLGQMFFHLGRLNIFWLLKERTGPILGEEKIKEKETRLLLIQQMFTECLLRCQELLTHNEISAFMGLTFW